MSAIRTISWCVASAAALAAVLSVGAARGEVRIVEGEVIFSIRAPEAKDVFLVGDFNNWNPTYEKMQKAGDVFEVALYLLPGTYRYKYVVDGKWMTDPDNPPARASEGSPLELREKAGTLVFGAGEESEKEAEEKIEPSLRYIGAFLLDDGKTSANQALDVWVSHTGKNVDAKVDFKTTGDTWDVSPLRAEILFDRGYVDLKLGGAAVKGFENDTIWTSSDPYHLVGRVGIYDYSAGYQRHGFAVETPPILKTSIRGLYCDRIGGRSGPPPTIEAEALEDFAASTGPDTTIYRYDNVFEDEDTWALEFVADAGSLDLGYAMRWNRGLHPGIVADVTRGATDFEALLQTTREFWNADAGWLRYEIRPRFAALAGFGRATADIRTGTSSTASFEDPEDLRIAQATATLDQRIPLQTSTRWTVGLEFGAASSRVRASYTWSEFEFDRGVYRPASADVNEVSVDAGYARSDWRTTATFVYLDQSYGGTPDDFHAFTPAKNFWLDDRDLLTISNMVAFDLERSTLLEAALHWNEDALSSPPAGNPLSAAAVLAAGLRSRDFLGAVEYAFTRLTVDLGLPRRLYAQWDTRVARYDKDSWDLEGTFLATYVEGGFRNEWLDLSLGIGLDPVVLDRVVNEYRDNGREEYLRQAIPADLTRSDSAALGDNLRRREEALRGYHPLKLELVVSF